MKLFDRVYIYYIQAGPANTPSIGESGHTALNFTQLGMKFGHGVVVDAPTLTCRAGRLVFLHFVQEI